MSEPAHQLPAERPPQPQKAALVATGGKPTAIIPHTVEEMFRLADAIHKSGLSPASQNTSQKVMVAIMAGAELGMPPWQSVQSFAVIGNRPSIWGDAIPALLWSNGFKLKEWFENEDPAYPPQMVAKCVVIRPDGTEVPGEFSVADAKEAGLWTKTGPWQTAKKRMLKMRARAFAARDGAADVLRGMQIREEVEDYVMGQHAPPREGGGLRERLQSHPQQATTGGFSAAHVESELSDTIARPREEKVVDAELVDSDGAGDLDIACEHCGAPAGVECRPDCPGAEDDDADAEGLSGISDAQDRLDAERASAGDQESGDRPGAAPAPATTADHAAEPSAAAGAGAATAASPAGGESPAIAWAAAIEQRIDEFASVAEIDAFTADPDNGRYFQELEAADAGRAKRLNAKIKGKRKALLDRERG